MIVNYTFLSDWLCRIVLPSRRDSHVWKGFNNELSIEERCFFCNVCKDKIRESCSNAYVP